jgi:hypothetical protein
MENFDRRTDAEPVKIALKPAIEPEPETGGETLRCALAGSDPVPTYNCAFRTSLIAPF